MKTKDEFDLASTPRGIGKAAQHFLFDATGNDNYWKEGNLPALVTMNDESSIIVREEHHFMGNPHRSGAPAIIHRDRTSGDTTLEEWWQGGVRHRPGGKPALQQTDPKTGVVTREEWWVDGVRHRAGRPALIIRDHKSGQTLLKAHYKKGNLYDPSEARNPQIAP